MFFWKERMPNPARIVHTSHPEVDMVSGGLSTPLPSSILHTSHPEVDMVRGGDYQHLSLVVSYILVILRLIWWEGCTRRGKDKVASMHCKKTILEKLEFPWMLTFEVEWKSHTVDISMIYDFHSTASVDMHWNFNLFLIFVNSVHPPGNYLSWNFPLEGENQKGNIPPPPHILVIFMEPSSAENQ